MEGGGVIDFLFGGFLMKDLVLLVLLLLLLLLLLLFV